jgi:hypothetical protein
VHHSAKKPSRRNSFVGRVSIGEDEKLILNNNKNIK